MPASLIAFTKGRALPSIIGTFFSNLKRVEFSDDIIVVHYKYGLSKSFALSNCAGFPCFEISSFSAKITFCDYGNAGLGYLKISPNGSKIAMVNFSDSIQLFNFDNSTGIVIAAYPFSHFH